MRRTGNGEPHVHRALASPSRVRILQILRAAPDGLGVIALAQRTGLHPSTVRSHLVVLADAGLVTHDRERSPGPGRPRLVFAAVPVEESDEEGYRFLAMVLAEHLRDGPDATTAAGEQAGRPWGAQLVENVEGSASVADVQARLVEMFTNLGFEPELASGDEPGASQILLHRCPFLELARANRDLVCGVHLGLLRGALEALAAPVQAVHLEPFVRPDLCVAHLAAQDG